ncbi:pyridoxal phosphate-dependent transferase [Panaeolus papilionaceus]|nr:pyridoxal phosphate-dependent transferase [Panaeolus papilionaceus]
MQLTAWTERYRQPPPPFGHACLELYSLDPEYLNLNNGSYGTTPKPVTQAIEELTLRVERSPDLFHRVEYQPMLKNVRARLADFVGAKTEEIMLVNNASMGINTILRNFQWEKGDVIFAFTTTYGSVTGTVKSISDAPPHPTVVTVPILFPTTKEEIIKTFKEFVAANPAQPNKKRVAVIDSIISNPGVKLPWEEMVQICKEESIWSVVDAAHSIGQEVGINLTKSGPDFWVSNCHKWLSAKRSCAVLYIAERNQHIIRTALPTGHTYKSHPVDQAEYIESQFEWNGTIDWAPYLSVANALDFRAWLGGEEKINEYCRDLAIKGGEELARILGTRLMDTTGEFTLNMTNVELPLPTSLKPTAELIARINRILLVDHKAFSAFFYHNGAWWTRCSAQVWNEVEDFRSIAKIWLDVCNDFRKELGLPE